MGFFWSKTEGVSACVLGDYNLSEVFVQSSCIAVKVKQPV